MEKLLAKRRTFRDEPEGEKRYELVFKDGLNYWREKEDRDAKITGYRKWEQAFRVYAHIFASANPHRSAEVWQYVDTIHSASTTFAWDNVMQYDFRFRKQIASMPQRCWGTVNTQLWAWCMRESVQQTRGGSQNYAQKGKKQGKEGICWKFNKHKCPRSAAECRFEHKCGYCGAAGHTSLACFKKKRDEESGAASTNANAQPVKGGKEGNKDKETKQKN